MVDHLLESSHQDDSNKWSNIAFGKEITQVEVIEVNFTDLPGALNITRMSNELQISDKSSYGLASAIPKLRRLSQASPIALMKAVKNDAEIDGMRRAHVSNNIIVSQDYATGT